MPLFTFRPRAWREIQEISGYLERETSLDIAERFLDAVIATSEELARMPRSGIRCEFKYPSTRRLRRWPIKDFENWLIFYQPTRDGIEVVRVLHGAQDITSILES